MTYTKPDDKTFTEMAIWIDENVYKDDCPDDMLYEYLYHLAFMLSGLAGYFSCANDYDSFCLYTASRLFMRLRNKQQFELNENGQPKMKIIKSILNYMKKIIYPYKVDFELQFKIMDKNIDILPVSNFNLGTFVSESTSMFDRVEFSLALSHVADIVKAHLLKIPYKKRSSEWTNIYISCMLTLMNSITLTANQRERFKTKIDDLSVINGLYSELRLDPPILYHLPEKMSNYVKVLVNELRHVLASEIGWREHITESAESTTKSLIWAAFDKEEDTQ